MKLKIKDKIINTKVMVSQKDIQTGMMGKNFNDKFNGMLFIMDGDEHCFWMKNCIIPLDIIFIKNNTITKIHHNCSPCESDECPNYCGSGDMVLELPGNYCKENDVTEGDKIIYSR
jgi:uncharacterized membrane protein (UPF0127 family)